jgi:hypothetical protein
MAVGQVSSKNIDNWQLINTLTVSSSANNQVIATGISGYKTLLLVVNNWTSSASANFGIYFNGDTTAGNYGSGGWGGGTGGGADSYIRVSYFNRTTPGTGYVRIENASNTTIPKTTFAAGDSGTWVDSASGIWNSTAAITSVTAYVTSGTIDTGTFKLYGLAE